MKLNFENANLGDFREVSSERLQTVCNAALTAARRAGAAGTLNSCGNVLTKVAGGLRHSFYTQGISRIPRPHGLAA